MRTKAPFTTPGRRILRPFGTGMAEPLRTPIFHIADILGWSATIATPGPQRNIRRAGVGPEQDRYDPGPRMGIDFARLPPREGKATPGFLWREAKQRASRRRLPPVVHAHSHASSAPSQARLLYPEASGILRRLPHTGGCLPGYRARTPWRPRRLPAVPERERHSPHRGWIIGRRTTVSRSDTPPLIVTMRSPWTCLAPQAVGVASSPCAGNACGPRHRPARAGSSPSLCGALSARRAFAANRRCALSCCFCWRAFSFARF